MANNDKERPQITQSSNSNEPPPCAPILSPQQSALQEASRRVSNISRTPAPSPPISEGSSGSRPDASAPLGSVRESIYRGTRIPDESDVIRDESIRGDLERAHDQHNPPTSTSPAGAPPPSPEGGPLPTTWQEAIPYVVWVVLVLGFGLELVAAFVRGEWAHFGVSLAGLVTLMAAALHWKQALLWAKDLSPNLVFGVFASVFLGLAISSYIEQHRWPFEWQISTASPPISEDVAKATASIQAELDAKNRQLQEERERAKLLIPPSGVITGLQLTNEVKDLRSQVDQLTRQRDAALAGAKPPAPVPSGGPIVWNSPEERQLFVVGADASGYIVSGALFWGESTEPVSITEAYAVSGMTGHKQELKANVPNRGYFPVDKVDIPPGAPVHLDLTWNPPIPLKDFLTQWGQFHVVVKYNGVKYERDYDEALVRQKLQQQAPDMFGPQMTPRDEK